jgi:acyl-CoA synthetase (AMP-forming)/AMP-acid ligase II
MAGNEPAIVAMLFATWGLGATAVPISIRSTAPEAVHLLEHAQASALLCDTSRTDVAREAATQTGVAAHVCAPDLPLTPKLLRRAKENRADHAAPPSPPSPTPPAPPARPKA